uniref:Uncharacterized protein n=1 Tax=Rhipicephalus pulchellus TaxID=72859 RepID=L7LVG0_RHIPC
MPYPLPSYFPLSTLLHFATPLLYYTIKDYAMLYPLPHIFPSLPHYPFPPLAILYYTRLLCLTLSPHIFPSQPRYPFPPVCYLYYTRLFYAIPSPLIFPLLNLTTLSHPLAILYYTRMLCFTLSPHIFLSQPYYPFPPFAILYYTRLCHALPSPLIFSLLLLTTLSHPLAILYYTIQECAMLYPHPHIFPSQPHYPFPPPCYTIVYMAMICLTISPPYFPPVPHPDHSSSPSLTFPSLCYTILCMVMLC